MGALPSRETNQRGLYSHRHGRNRRNEIVLIPLTRTFFPSPQCPLFQRLFESRTRRTAKYYYRALRSTTASKESDYFCNTTATNAPEEFHRWDEERRRAAPSWGDEDTDYQYESFADTPEGLYRVLIEENELCLYDTDEALRQAYLQQVRTQRADWERMTRMHRDNAASAASRPVSEAFANALGGASPAPVPFENVPLDAFLAGYAAAKRYVRGKALHTYSETADGGGCPGGPEGATTCRKHVTSPAAYYLRPLPCAIVSRHDPNKAPPLEDATYVEFEGSYFKVLGMFGMFPATVPMRYRARDAEGPGSLAFPRKEGHTNADEDMDAAHEVEQHLLKGTMFVDKDVGDQILGNVVVLATHMYVRQCVEAHLQPRFLPMLPVLLRAPLSNIPMLQFVRELRVRLRTLLEAGTAVAGQRPVHVGLSGFNPHDIAEPHQPASLRLEEEGYLFEEDIPDAVTPAELFQEAFVGSSSGLLRRPSGSNTNPHGTLPILMMSGFNVQSTPLRHPALSATGYDGAAGGGGRARWPVSRTASLSGPGGPAAPLAAARSESSSSPGSPVSSFPAASPVPAGRSGSPTTAAAASEAYKTALLLRRKNRFRIWVEHGHLCIWASAAYARRACLILAQQLNTTVDSDAVPEQRSWIYRGVLHAGAVVPPPRGSNDVYVVGEDIPAAGLWQGDVLRCCTEAERWAAQRGLPLPLPCRPFPPGWTTTTTAAPPLDAPGLDSTVAASTEGGTSAYGAAGNGVTGETMASAPAPSTSLNFNSHSASGLLPPEPPEAPSGSFWVRASGGLDDSLTNISEPNMTPTAKMERQQQQQQQQQATAVAAAQQQQRKKKTPFAPTTAGVTGKSQANHLTMGSSRGSYGQGLSDMDMPPESFEIDRREGTLNIEEVILSWMKMVSILTRDVAEGDSEWVRDPAGHSVRVDRYAIRRFEHDGVRYFIGVAPRFVGQQRRIEKVLDEVYALEEHEQPHSQEPSASSAEGVRLGGTFSPLTFFSQTTPTVATGNFPSHGTAPPQDEARLGSHDVQGDDDCGIDDFIEQLEKAQLSLFDD